MIVNTAPLIEACDPGEATFMVNEFDASVTSMTWMFPVPKATFSLKVRTIELFVAIPVAPSVGELEVNTGSVVSVTIAATTTILSIDHPPINGTDGVNVNSSMSVKEPVVGFVKSTLINVLCAALIVLVPTSTPSFFPEAINVSIGVPELNS